MFLDNAMLFIFGLTDLCYSYKKITLNMVFLISLFIVNNTKEKDDSQHEHEQLETSGVRNKAFVLQMCE